MKFAVANQFFMIADQAGVDYTNVLRAIREDYPRAADLPGPGFAAGPCLFKDTMQLGGVHHGPLPARPGGDAGQRGPARLHRVGARTPLRRAAGQDRGHPRHGLQGRIGRHRARRSATSCASCSSWAGARVLATDPYVATTGSSPLECVLEESDILVLGAPHKATAASSSAARTSSTSGALPSGARASEL